MRRVLHAFPLLLVALVFCLSTGQMSAQCEDIVAGGLAPQGSTEVCLGDLATIVYAYDGTETPGLDFAGTNGGEGYGIQIDLSNIGLADPISFITPIEGITLAEIDVILMNNGLALTPGVYTIVGTLTYSGLPADATAITQAECLNVAAAEYAVTVLAVDDMACTGGEILGCTDPEALNFNPEATQDDGTCEFATDCADGELEVVLDYTVDNWASEIGWELTDESGAVVASLECGTLADGEASYSDAVCLPAGVYTFSASDDWGDGWFSNDVQGVMTISVNGESVLSTAVNDGVAGDEVADCISSVEFSQCIGVGVVVGCTDPEAINYNAEAVADCTTCLFAEGASDECADAIVLELPGATGSASYGPYDGSLATLSDGDPAFADCLFPAGDVYSNTQWFSFVGDGNTYAIYTSNACAGDTLDQASWDSQMVIFTGECGALEEVACNEDLGDATYVVDPATDYEAGVNFTTEPGVQYTVLVDGYQLETGNYCMRVVGATPCVSSVEPAADAPTVLDFNPQCGTFQYTWDVENLNLGFEWENDPAAEIIVLASTNDPMGGNPLGAGALFLITPVDGAIPLDPGTAEGFSPYGGDAATLSTLYFTLTVGSDPDGDGTYNVVGNGCPAFATTSIQVNYLITDEPCDEACGAVGGALEAPASTAVEVDGMNEAPIMTGGSDGAGFTYTYILINAAGDIVDDSDTGVFSFAGLAEGDYQVYGLAVTGNDFAVLGLLNANATISDLLAQTDVCAALSDFGINYSVGGVVGCEAEAAIISTESATTFCTDDGEADIVAVIIAGGVGAENAIVITDAALNILNIVPAGVTEIDFEGSPEGTCLIWHVSYDSLEGAEIGANAGDLGGCFALSNNIEVVRTSCTECTAEASVISTESETTVCSDDGEADLIDVIIDGGVGSNAAYVITEEDGTILGINPELDSSIDLEGAPAGVCLIWVIHYNTLEGADAGANAADLTGCFELSNPITVTRTSCSECTAEASVISTESETTVCSDDGEADLIDVIIDGGVGENAAYVITEEDGTILAINPELDSFIDLEGAPAGICLIWVIHYNTLEGANAGANAADLTGCFELSNPITVTRTSCSGECEAEAGTLDAFDEFACGGDITLSATGASADYALVYVLTDNDLNIMSLSTDGAFAGLTAGTSYLPHALSMLAEEIPADPTVLIGLNALDVVGGLSCFDLETANSTFTALDPISIAVEYFCDQNSGVYTLTIAFSGGLPAVDPSEGYTASGFSLSGEFFPGENTVLEFAENEPYEIIASDASGCPSVTDADEPIPCNKTAIDLVSFEGRTAGDANLLTWATATEAGNDYFEVYSSVDGLSFDLVGTVNAVGNANTVSNYELTDVNAPKLAVAYYQLVAVDVNGLTSKSSIITVGRDITAVITDVAPVPAVNSVTINVSAVKSSASTVQVFDLSGRVINTIEVEIIEGLNNIELDLNGLASGVYIFSVSTDNAVLDGKFIKQ